MLLDRIADAGLSYFMEVPHNVRVWVTRPPMAVPAVTGKKGHPFTCVRLAPGAPAPVRVDTLAAALPPSAWQVAQIQEGGKGPLVAEVARVRAVAIRDGLPGPEVWVVLRRALDTARELKIYLFLMPSPRLRRRRWCGCSACAGRSSGPSKRRRANWGWTTTRYGAGAAGITTPP